MRSLYDSFSSLTRHYKTNTAIPLTANFPQGCAVATCERTFLREEFLFVFWMVHLVEASCAATIGSSICTAVILQYWIDFKLVLPKLTVPFGLPLLSVIIVVTILHPNLFGIINAFRLTCEFPTEILECVFNVDLLIVSAFDWHKREFINF